jgi:hypothetical protein
MHCKHLAELAELRCQLEAVRADYAALRAAVLARQEAEQVLAALYRERELARARAVERNPTQPLQ